MSNDTTLPVSTPKHLALKVIQIMGALQRLPKNGFNELSQYHYVQEADVTDQLRGLMTQAHLVLFSQVESVSRENDLTTTWMTFTLIDADSGETHVARWPGQGHDRSDKGIAKAITAATKYFLLKTFMLSAGDDPEQDRGTLPDPATKSSKSGTAPSASSATSRPTLPKEPFAVRIIAGAMEPRKVREGDLQLFFRGQALLESTQETFGITAWRANAQLLAQAQKQSLIAVISGQWHDRYPEFKVQTTAWPPGAPSDPKTTPTPPTPAAEAESEAPSGLETHRPGTELKQALWTAAQQQHLDLAGLQAFASEQLQEPITNLAELPLAQVQALLTVLQARAFTSQAS